ncbi:MAG: tetratricopeptide repeat protein, partial [Planctomycetales bacterium]|nr:tetratricopeptide repeat protein [Planctomycetales bacterium]
ATPDDIQLLRQFARACMQDESYIDALRALDRLIGLDAANDQDWCLTGNALCEVSEFAQSLGAFQAALQLESQNIEARHNLGRAYYRLGDVDRAVSEIKAVAQQTDALHVWAGLATCAPGAISLDQHEIRQIRETFAAQLRRLEQPVLEFDHLPRRSNHTAIRIGYLSAHLHNANYMKPVWPLINYHDRSQFQIHLLNDAEPTSEFDWLNSTENIVVHHVNLLSNRDLAQRIDDLQIDVLVDLSAFSKPNRLGVFVHRPAPVQAAWFNMYATSGLSEIDYIIGDGHVVYPSEQQFYTERIVQLPLSYLTFETNHDAPDVAATPCLEKRMFTFGCLATQYKITRIVLDAWADILQQVPHSRLLMANRDVRSPQNRQYVIDQFGQRGVGKDRLEFGKPGDHFQFLKTYDAIDVALDPFPYNGGTTTMEALWQGVPVVSLDGDRWAARTSKTLMCEAGLSEFVAADVPDYIRIATSYADESKWDRLSELRLSMRALLLASSACDGRRLAQAMESLFSGFLQA